MHYERIVDGQGTDHLLDALLDKSNRVIAVSFPQRLFSVYLGLNTGEGKPKNQHQQAILLTRDTQFGNRCLVIHDQWVLTTITYGRLMFL